MPKFMADIPAYVTVRFEAKDEDDARRILLENFDKAGIECGASDIAIDADGDVSMSPAITLYPSGIETPPDKQMTIFDDDDDEDRAPAINPAIMR
jgi:hypothetical protein